MKNKPIFSRILTVIIIALICLVLTVALALLFGSINTDLFNFSNLNISNTIFIFIIGTFISCVIIGILVIILTKEILLKLKNDFFETNNGGNKK